MKLNWLLLGTCKERNLRRKDPHVVDENHTFLGSDAVAQNASASSILSWADTSGLDTFVSNAALAPSSVFGDRLSLNANRLMWMDSAPILAAEDPTKELYIRIKLYHILAGAHAGDYPVLVVKDAQGDDSMRISLVPIDPEDFRAQRVLKVDWFDLDGLAKTVTFDAPGAIMQNNSPNQMRLFFYQDRLEIEVEPYKGETTTTIIPTNFIRYAGDGYQVLLGSDLMVPASTGFPGCIMRVGYGNDITTRPPTPP